MNDTESGNRSRNEHLIRPAREDKVVLHLTDGSTVKGYLNLGSGNELSDLFTSSESSNPRPVNVRLLNDSLISLQISGIKAVYFVKSFRGDATRKGLRFYSNGPSLGGIWVEVQFHDNEIVEGTIDNSARHLIGDGFFLHPSDSESNNLLIFINKMEIASFRVLGVKASR